MLKLAWVGCERRIVARSWGIERGIALLRLYLRRVFIGFGSDEKELASQVGCELSQIRSVHAVGGGAEGQGVRANRNWILGCVGLADAHHVETGLRVECRSYEVIASSALAGVVE